MTTSVEIVGLSKRYGSVAAVAEFSLSVVPDQITALLGPSGSGKTTILKMIAGVLQPTAGDILFDGVSVVDVPAEKRDAPMVFHKGLLFPYLTVEDNVGFGLRMRKTHQAARSQQVDEMLDLVGLRDLGDRKPAELSGGQQQRAALARALIVRPRVLLLDEPLANLDPDLRDEMRELVVSIQRRLGITVVLVTHDRDDAVKVADRVAIIRDGRLVQEGVPRDFFERPVSAEVARFFGTRNLIHGTLAGREVATALGPLVVAESVASGPVVVAIRPESVVLGGPARGPNTFEATVAAAEFRGDHIGVHLYAGGVEVVANIPVHDQPPPRLGDTIRVTLPPERLWPMASE